MIFELYDVNAGKVIATVYDDMYPLPGSFINIVKKPYQVLGAQAEYNVPTEQEAEFAKQHNVHFFGRKKTFLVEEYKENDPDERSFIGMAKP